MEAVHEIELQNVAKRFGEVIAVDSVSLSVLRGEFLTLLGPSGCGKTTLLRMIAGFERPDSGRVVLGGREVTQLSPHQRDVTTVFQHYALFPHLSVFDNVAFGLERRSVARDEIKRRCDLAGLMSASRASCQGDSNKESRWLALWWWSRECCCWTSRLPRSI